MADKALVCLFYSLYLSFLCDGREQYLIHLSALLYSMTKR